MFNESGMLLKRMMVAAKLQQEHFALARNEDGSANVGQKIEAVYVRDPRTLVSGRMAWCGGRVWSLGVNGGCRTHVYDCFKPLENYQLLSFLASPRPCLSGMTVLHKSFEISMIGSSFGARLHSKTRMDHFYHFIISRFPLVHRSGRRLGGWLCHLGRNLQEPTHADRSDQSKRARKRIRTHQALPHSDAGILAPARSLPPAGQDRESSSDDDASSTPSSWRNTLGDRNLQQNCGVPIIPTSLLKSMIHKGLTLMTMFGGPARLRAPQN
jgi:hypothetical protein